MNNMILLQKNEDGSIYCKAITQKGKEYHLDPTAEHDDGFWDKGGTILLEELEEILNREI